MANKIYIFKKVNTEEGVSPKFCYLDRKISWGLWIKTEVPEGFFARTFYRIPKAKIKGAMLVDYGIDKSWDTVNHMEL
jgi:hypothetical protein